MSINTFESMTDQEFVSIFDQIGDQDPDVISPSDFMETLWEIRSNDVENVIELTARLRNDHVEIEAPDGVAVHGNEVIFSNQRIIIHWA